MIIGLGVGLPFARSAGYNIGGLFANGEQGAWYDPSDFSTLYQDSAGTTPVTAVGQPVGKMLDKSGRGNHATQPTAINRPVIQIDGNGKHYLAFNGTNSWMSTGNFGLVQPTVMHIGLLASSVTTFVVDGLTLNSGSVIPALESSGNTTRLYGGSGDAYSAQALTLSIPHIITTTQNGNNSFVRLDKVEGTHYTGAGMTSAMGGLTIGVGGNGTSLFFNGNIYSLIVRGALSSNAQISSAETYANSKTGAY
jgi:hypothetical protein